MREKAGERGKLVKLTLGKIINQSTNQVHTITSTLNPFLNSGLKATPSTLCKGFSISSQV